MNKDRILELAHRAGFNWPEISTTTIEERLERFAAMIEREVRKDAEPVAWMTFDGEGSYELRLYDENEDYADKWDKRNPNHKGWVTPLYPHPTSETTDQLMSIIDLYEKALLTTFPQGASDEVFEYWNKARKALNKIKD